MEAGRGLLIRAAREFGTATVRERAAPRVRAATARERSAERVGVQRDVRTRWDRSLAVAALSSVAVLTAAAAAQTPQPATQPQAPELPEAVRTALADTQDFAFNFDQPGFYAVVEFVKQGPRSPGFAEAPLVVADWRDLLERPGDFRGRPVTITGIVGHNKDPYVLQTRPDLGPLTQLELRRDDQPLATTLIFTGRAADIPLGAELTATGYFVLIRQYHDARQQVRPAALVVAPGPTTVAIAAPVPPALDWRWFAAAVVVGIVLTLWLLRRARRHTPRDVRTLRASHAPPVSLADDLTRWAEREDRDGH